MLIPGAAAPKLFTLDMVEKMRPGSVLVDIVIDRGGCFESSRPSTHAAPTCKVQDDLYHRVTNTPGVVPQTSSAALTNATLPYALRIATKGWKQAMAEDAGLANGLMAHAGLVTFASVAEAPRREHVSLEGLLAGT